MKRFQFKTGLIFASWALLLIFGCHKKKPHIPPAEMAPTIISQIPIQDTGPKDSQGTQEQTPPAPDQQAANTKPPAQTAPPKHPKHVPRKVIDENERPATTEIAKNNPPPGPAKAVIQEGGNNVPAASGQITAGGTPEDAAHSQATTQQLIDSTETNLKSLNKRQLSADEQSTVNQINDYIKQSQQATKDGDLVRAHNLALKAHLLSDELAKAR